VSQREAIRRHQGGRDVCLTPPQRANQSEEWEQPLERASFIGSGARGGRCNLYRGAMAARACGLSRHGQGGRHLLRRRLPSGYVGSACNRLAPAFNAVGGPTIDSICAEQRSRFWRWAKRSSKWTRSMLAIRCGSRLPQPPNSATKGLPNVAQRSAASHTWRNTYSARTWIVGLKAIQYPFQT